ncbi:FecR protein [Algoriphagus locisalis]|uniref:FecR protein n=1 Tax=Algoriphagus locisalis TaxID=305507 RepID=A0A1I7CRI1_9BACT|nr:FecR family protein [Algoriphagus locisalis]SFU02035.1 FecR protein [Algoriphagus locisalis]
MNPELVKKFFEGKCSPEEVHQVLIWINSEDGAMDLEDELEKFEGTENANSIRSKAMLEKIHQRIMDSENELSPKRKAKVRSLKDQTKPTTTFFHKWKLGVAASIILTMVASAVWLFSSRREVHSEANVPAQIEYLTRVTQAGEKLTLKLNDGSVIQMNSNSKVRFPKSFSENSRDVYMQGQVFFDVQRDESKPFLVHSKGLVTSVLGTSFSIQEDSISQFSQVAVLIGKVKVSKSEEEGRSGESLGLFLEPMDAARFDGTQGSLEQIKVDYDQAFAWKDNVIVFRDASFDEVIRRLENWYGVSFQQNREFKNQKEYTGNFDNQSLEDVLIGLSFTYDFQFEINKSTIIIH